MESFAAGISLTRSLFYSFDSKMAIQDVKRISEIDVQYM